MAFQRQKAEWERTAGILSMLFNINRGRNTSPKKPSEFNPYDNAAGPQVLSKSDARALFSALAGQMGGKAG